MLLLNQLGRNYPGWQLDGWKLSGWELSWVEIFKEGVIMDENFSGGNCSSESYPR